MGNILERSIDFASGNLLTRQGGIDGADVIALVQQIFHYEIGGAHVVVRGANKGDRLHLAEDVADIVQGIAVVIHRGLFTSIRQRSSHLGGRLSTKAPMPSLASWMSRFSTI